MNFYNFLYSSYYNLLSKINNSDPEYTSFLFVAATQIIHLILLLTIVQSISGIHLINRLFSIYYMVFLSIPWGIVLYIYYSKTRRKKLLNRFNEKSENEKTIWYIISLAAFFIPIILIISL